jgi:alpha-1,3-rhamnosyl/mannosyltransferase
LAAFGDWQKLRVDCRQARHAALVATDSEHARDTLLPLLRLPADRVPVHLMPLDPHFRPIPAGARQRGLAALGIQSPYLLFIGGTRRRKNLARLLAAWAILSPAARRGRRLLAAAVPDARLCALGRRAGDVVWLGHVDDAVLPLLYGGADFLAYPSLAEGFGLPPLEAAACGTPSLVSDNGALVETAAGFSLAVDPFSTQALADGIRRLLSDHRLCDRLRAAGGAVRARHSPCRVARALENLFQAAVERTTADRRWDRRIDFS